MLKKTLHFCLLLLFFLPALLQAQETNRVAVVVRLDDESTETRCVSFTEEQLSGAELLERSGLAVVVEYGALGGAVCQIEGTGCPAGDCFCQCKGSDCHYWSYWHLQDGDWQYASIGATLYQVQDGTVEGWSWGPGSVTQAVEPPLTSFEEVCSAGDGNGPLSAPTEQAADVPEWQPYALFGAVMIGLAVVYLVMRRRASQ